MDESNYRLNPPQITLSMYAQTGTFEHVAMWKRFCPHIAFLGLSRHLAQSKNPKSKDAAQHQSLVIIIVVVPSSISADALMIFQRPY